ncbi:MAG: 4-(cytidine 5'-diphospho)-2-C-methyl-D-erythritol kinase [Nanoarchaeota archaeon]
MIKAYAKLNLCLDVLDKREDGFHNINSIMQQINIYDELEFKESSDVKVHSPIKDDIIFKTALKLRDMFNVEKGVEIFVKKNIPVGSGLGGGSADASATLIELNNLWDLGLGIDEMVKIGVSIGADVPFFLYGGRCFVCGIGEKVEKISSKEMDILLVNPGYGISTKDAYSKLDHVDFQRTNSSLRFKDGEFLLHNDFINIQKDDVIKIIEEVKKLGALDVSITGKGPTVFGVFDDGAKLDNAYKMMKDSYPFVHKTRTVI